MQVLIARLLLLSCLLALPAHAGQLSASAALDSDDRFRGVSLSHGRPDVRLDVNYDEEGGLYGGISLAAAPGRGQSAPLTHYTAYAGYVTRPASDLSWEGGVSHTHIDDRERYDYDELYAGLITAGITARLSYSPRYYGRDVQTLYADLSGSRQISPHVRLFAHAGWLRRLSGTWGLRPRYDLSAGVAAALRACELRLSVTQTPSLYAWGREDGGTGIVLSAVRAF
ncbi:TorF family putative porin [Asticcacaulis solisilvae]|uniref:TorF family putative porin n=1 Tax=Asticcacaulis solisilvae TaxID=1217274 RepID=UPI003FD8A478